ncbi:transposase (fragment) [Parafrankia sp. Ea1.12]
MSRTAGRWFVSFTVQVEREIPDGPSARQATGGVIGVDLAKQHAHTANQRRDGLHKVTTNLARTHHTVVIEDLHVAGMVRNHNLAKAVSDVGMGELRRQLEYKCGRWVRDPKTRTQVYVPGWHGAHLHVAGRW